MSPKSISLQHLASVCLQLTARTSQLISNAFINKEIVSFRKSEDDFVTQIDYKVQGILMAGIRKHFPLLKIVGEESQQNSPESNVDPFELPNNFNLGFGASVENEGACLWIDPVDCTRGFINGVGQDVTTLIGLSYKGRPVFGVIAMPIAKKDGFHFACNRTVFGSVPDGKVWQYNDNKLTTLRPQPQGSPIKIALSSTRRQATQNDYIEHMQAERVMAGGSGRKIMMTVDGHVDAMTYIDKWWTHKWDSCAGDAVVRALGGHFTTLSGKDINYYPGEETCNKEGFICTLHDSIYHRSLEFYKDKLQF